MKTVGDVNVIFALLLSTHVHHAAAWTWWQPLPDDSLALCWLTRLGVMRLLTNSKAMNGSPLSNQEALNAWDVFAQDPRTFWSEPGASHELYFRNFATRRQRSPNLWSDAWLAALAESQGWRLTSFDADFCSFSLTDFEHLAP